MFASVYVRICASAITLFTASLLATTTLGQDSRFEFPGVSTGLRDEAKVFSPEAVRKAKGEIDRIERETRASILIETVNSVADEAVKTVAAANARRWGREGMYVLIDKNDHRFEIVPSGSSVEKAITREDSQTIRDAFLTDFKRGKFDDGLINGLKAMTLILSNASRDGKLGRPLARPGTDDEFNQLSQGPHPASPLILRQQNRLTLAAARLIVAGAQAKAVDLKIKANVAVVDDGGHLITFDRMDGARPASVYTAITKATSAATFRTETGPIGKDKEKDTPADLLLNLSVQNAAAASGGKITSLSGGIPVIIDGQVVGAVGVGGGSGDQDAQVARAGLDRLSNALKLEAENK